MTPEPPQEAFHDLLRGMAALSGNRIVADIARLYGKGAPPDLSIACNHKQIASKQWLVEALVRTCPKPEGPVWVLGAWYGVLGAMMLDDTRLTISAVISLDRDLGCAAVAEKLNRRHLANGRFEAVTADMMTLDFAAIEPAPGLVINTSCEHLADVPGWLGSLPAGMPVLLQSNDYVREPDHRSCVPSLQAFIDQAQLSEVVFSGALPTRNYTRIKLIGRR